MVIVYVCVCLWQITGGGMVVIFYVCACLWRITGLVCLMPV